MSHQAECCASLVPYYGLCSSEAGKYIHKNSRKEAAADGVTRVSVDKY